MKISLQTENSPVVESAVKIIARVLGERAGLTLERDSKNPDLALALDKKLPLEGYSISDCGKGVRVSGGDPNGLLYGVGAWLRGLSFQKGSFAHGSWRGASSPATPLRGMYLATHFGNYYDEAPLDEIGRCLEDLALWGCNSLAVWFDMHHFTGISDPRAQKKIRRLRHILERAEKLGMSAALLGLANEAYSDSPAQMRADWTPGHDGYERELCGHYHVELCPSQPGAMETLMRWREEVFDAFAGIDARHVICCPYDQGGCTCPKCAPWGADGMLRTTKEYSRLAREKFPGCKVIMSGWRFDVFTKGEWDGVRRAFAKGQDYVDMLHIDLGDMDKILPATPGGLPVVGMPEISMRAMTPWGGYGANPMPGHLRVLWDKARNLAGTYPYSEGVYEDMNKAVILQLEWNPSISAADAVREYASFHFGKNAADDARRATELLEKNLGHDAVVSQDGKNYNSYDIGNTSPDRPWSLRHNTEFAWTGRAKGDFENNAVECLSILEGAAAGMPEWAGDSWRWKILLLRAAVDAEIARSSGAPTEKMDECFYELRRLYHANDATLPCVTPPGLRTWEFLIRNRASGRV